MNNGVDVQMSPMKFAGMALTAGSLQRLYLDERSKFQYVSKGVEQSRMQRLARQERPVRGYNNRMILLSPPILMQRRVEASNKTSTECKVDPAA